MMAPVEIIAVDELARVNAIDLSENGIYDALGARLRSHPLPIKTATVEFLRTVHALQAPGRTVWEMKSRASGNSRRVIDGWRETLRSGVSLGLSDILILDSNLGEGAPISIDGHHRIVAAVHEGCTLRYVDLADLPE